MLKICKLVGLIVLVYTNTIWASEILQLPIVRVLDGDTIETRIHCLPDTLGNIKIRVKGIDTPEIHSKCNNEVISAQQSKQHLLDIIKDATTMTVFDCENDKYGGRWACYVVINNIDITNEMIISGHARVFNGKSKKTSWCDKYSHN